MTYFEKLKDPRWQKKRLEVLNRDEFTCRFCYDGASILHVHHLRYVKNGDPWDSPLEDLITLCESCHEQETASRKSTEQDLIDLLKLEFPVPLSCVASLNCTLRVAFSMHMPDVALSALDRVVTKGINGKSFIDYYFEQIAPPGAEGK